ncbi:CehA/McbA family metallohydrolase [Haladaptatus halobius]|uniref:CehA/McbA family metallohydrolase n=1 Tax=Haladaptatus halobius TaxID=2884875 RepID=UPI001D0B6627|nr:PHP domain-containing protein [Haladaptatus halobius]
MPESAFFIEQVSPGVTVTIDPHVHSEGSFDGHDPVELLLEQASDIGLDAIVITDHDTIAESKRAAALADDYGLIGIPGVEVSTADGHLLAIGVETLPTPNRSLSATVEEIRDLGGVAVVPHPFQWSRHGVRKRNITDCDAVEVYNSWLFTGHKNRRAKAYADEHGYPSVAASDAHSASLVGRAYTELTIDSASSVDEIDTDTIVEAFRDGTTRIRGKRTPIHHSTYHYAIGASKRANATLTSSNLNIAALLTQAAYAFHRGKLTQGTLLFGAATLSLRDSRLWYLAEGMVTAKYLTRRVPWSLS